MDSNSGNAGRLFDKEPGLLTELYAGILATIDSGTSSSGGTWKLQAKLSAPPTSGQFLQVKAKKLTVGKFVCKADLSGLIPIQ